MFFASLQRQFPFSTPRIFPASISSVNLWLKLPSHSNNLSRGPHTFHHLRGIMGDQHFLPAPASWGAPALEDAAQEAVRLTNKHVSENMAFVKKEDVPDPAEMTPDMRLLHEASVNGGRIEKGAHSPEARAFEKMFRKALALDKVLSSQYQGVGKNYARQREIKQKWASASYEEKVSSKSWEESLVDMSSFDGEYCTFPRSWDREGRDQLGYRTTMTYVLQVMKKWKQGITWHGKPYVKYDQDRKSAVILHLREKVGLTSSTTYSLKHTETTADKKAPVAPATSASSRESDPETPVKKGYSTKRSADQITGVNNTGVNNEPEKGDDDPPPAGKKAKLPTKKEPLSKEELEKRQKEKEKEKERKQAIAKRMTAALKKLQDLKAEVDTTCQGAADVLAMVARDPSWAWANHGEVLGPLRKTLQSIDAFKSTGEFWKKWTSSPEFGAVARSSMEIEQVESELHRATQKDKAGTFAKSVALLSRQTRALREMHERKTAADEEGSEG